MKYNFFLLTAVFSLFLGIGALIQWGLSTQGDAGPTLAISYFVIGAIWYGLWLLSSKLPTSRVVARKYSEIRSGIYQAVQDSIDLEYGKYGAKHSPLETFYSTVNMRRRSLPPLAAKAYKHHIYAVLDSPSFKSIQLQWRARR